MKKKLILLIIVFCTTNLYAQMSADSLKYADNDAVYRLFPTHNMWTFIKLNTRNGKMWQVQYSLKDSDHRFESSLNLIPLVTKEEEVNGRFLLYSTTNIYNFILLDQLDGRTWQVQWSIKAAERQVIPIR